MRGLDLFAGIGGASLAMQSADIEVVAHAEIEPFPCRVLEHRFPDVPNLGDVSKITAEQLDALGPIDVVSFGSPCQDWSIAGKRLGLKGHRSSLFHEAIRIIRLCRPRFAVFENVPGLFSSAGGWDFAAVLDEMAESGALDIAWRVLDAQWFGVPQRRRRIFVIADFRGESAGEILSISEGVFRHPTPSREAGEEAARGSGDGVEGAFRNAGRGWWEKDSIASPPGTQGRGIHETNLVASTLGGGAGRRGWADDTDRMTFIPEVSFAFNANERWDGESETFIPIQDGRARAEKSQNGSGVGEDGDPAYTVDTLGAQAVAFAKNQRAEVRTSEVHPQLTSGGRKPGQGYPAVAFALGPHASTNSEKGHQPHAKGGPTAFGLSEELAFSHRAERTQSVASGMAVRRLTPTECERLQGVPDGWTDIPGASDSARYRALGNAWAYPVGAWVMQRIVGTEEERHVRDTGTSEPVRGAGDSPRRQRDRQER